MENENRSSFTGQLGFILAAAGSAVGLGNIWRFPYLAAKDGGGVFLFAYIILALTFGFTLLVTEIAIGRHTAQGPLTAYGKIHQGWGFIGVFATIVPAMILPYYSAIGGWVLKYLSVYVTGQGAKAAADGYFGSFISSQWEPIIWFVIYLGATAFIVFKGVEEGIEKYSKVLMPILFLLIVGICFFAMTLKNTDESGVTRTGLQGLKIYLIPDFSGMTLREFLVVVMDAVGQLFYSISVAMGIMVAYGSYAKKDTNLMTSVNQIEFFDSMVAILAGMMIIPAVYVFMGREGMSAGPGLMFISLPKVFHAMGPAETVIGLVFFLMVTFAALTSSVSIMEAIVSSLVDRFHMTRQKATILTTVYSLIFGIIVCLGYNVLYFEFRLPNDSIAQILDIMDYVSNNILMPVVALCTCLLIGWVAKPQLIIDEVTQGKFRFNRKGLYIVMVRFVAPALLFILLLKAFGLVA